MEYKTSEEYRSQPLKGLNNSSGQFGSKVLRGHQKDGPVTDEEYNNVKSDRRLKTATIFMAAVFTCNDITMSTGCRPD